MLAPSQSSAATTELVVPPGTAPGRYYVVGVADYAGAAVESSGTNNTRITSLLVGPDLTLSALVAPSSATAGRASA